MCVCFLCCPGLIFNVICVLLCIGSPFLCSEDGIKDCLHLLPHCALDNHVP